MFIMAVPTTPCEVAPPSDSGSTMIAPKTVPSSARVAQIPKTLTICEMAVTLILPTSSSMMTATPQLCLLRKATDAMTTRPAVMVLKFIPSALTAEALTFATDQVNGQIV